jgi:aspartyl-tRNA(Asn)/glutamyl-tRNA(Gln) amidotransferase subunit A
VAIATGCVVAALGTDTGGSIRIPASLCGVVGFKPSRGAVSTRGVVPLSTTLDEVGPLARSVSDCATMLAALAPSLGAQCIAACQAGAGAARVGVVESFAGEAAPEVGAAFAVALRLLEALGCRLRQVRLPGIAGALQILGAIYRPEAARAHAARLRERSEDFGDKVRRDLERGLASEPARYEEALLEMTALAAELAAASEGVDLLACPTTPRPAGPLGDPDGHAYLRFTCGFNLSGQPAISEPMGLADGLPVGLQLVGRPGDDARVFALAAAFEERLGWGAIPTVARSPALP